MGSNPICLVSLGEEELEYTETRGTDAQRMTMEGGRLQAEEGGPRRSQTRSHRHHGLAAPKI